MAGGFDSCGGTRNPATAQVAGRSDWEYQLTAEEASFAELIARERTAPKLKYKVASKKIDPRKTDFEITRDGTKAEVAVAQMLGIRPDCRIFIGGDKHESDLIAPDGQTISVKYRTKRGWDFALTADDVKEFKAGIGLLVWPTRAGTRDAYEIVAWVDRACFQVAAKITNYGYGKRLVMRQSEMHDMKHLKIPIGGFDLKRYFAANVTPSCLFAVTRIHQETEQ